MGAEWNASSADAQPALVSEEEELRLLNFPPAREDLSTAVPLTLVFGLLLVTGCAGNLCTAIVIARPRNKYMHTATNCYLFSLALSDFLFLTLGLPQEMYALWQRYPYAFGELFCVLRGYLSEASTYASILTISAFTAERYVAICHPLWAHTMSQLPRAITSVVIIWCVAAVCAVPPAAELGIVTQRGPISNRTLEQSAQCATKRTLYDNMFVVSALVFFLIPMLIVTVLYILIALELRRSTRAARALSASTSAATTSAAATSAAQCARPGSALPPASASCRCRCHARAQLGGSLGDLPAAAAPTSPRPHAHSPLSYHESLAAARPPACSWRDQRRRPPAARARCSAASKKSVVRMLVAVVVSFFICWLPFHAQRLLASYLAKSENQNQVLLDIYLKLTYISGVMYYLSSTINPLLYQLMSAKFRLAFKDTFNCSLLQCAPFAKPHPPPQPANAHQLQLHAHSPAPSPKGRRGLAALVGVVSAASSQPLGRWESNASELGPDSCAPDCACRAIRAEARATPPSTFARLRGRIGGSVTSLLRLSSVRPPGEVGVSAAATSGTCARCDCDAPSRAPAPSPAAPAHSTLKFVKSPAGSSCALAGRAPSQCLTRLSSHGDDDQERATPATQLAPEAAKLSALISATLGSSEQLDVGLAPPSTSAESGHSTGSSPEQQHQQQQVRTHTSDHHHKLPTLNWTEDTRTSPSAPPEVALTHTRADGGRRRRSLYGAGQSAIARRKSSSSSGAKRHPSSSLSSSERQLDLKLSLSTTASAPEDYGSFTTTNSQLTGVGSSAQLSSRRDSCCSAASAAPVDADASPKRRIGRHRAQAGSEAAEPLLGARPQVAPL